MPTDSKPTNTETPAPTEKRPWWPVRAVQLWLGAEGLRMSAAMSFYGLLSLAPLLVVVVAGLGWWVDKAVIESNLLAQVRAFTSERIAEVVQQALASAQAPSQGLVASAIALVLLLWGATGAFSELQAGLARLWQEEKPTPSKRPAWWGTLAARLRGLLYVAGLAVLLLVSLLLSTALAVATAWLGKHFPYRLLLLAVSEGISFLFAAGLFVGLMRISVDPKPRLRYLMQGGLIGAGLFTIGRHGLAAYLSGAAVVSAYGAAGSLVALLMWIYFSSAVLLLSAGCARALQERAEALAAPSN